MPGREVEFVAARRGRSDSEQTLEPRATRQPAAEGAEEVRGKDDQEAVHGDLNGDLGVRAEGRSQ